MTGLDQGHPSAAAVFCAGLAVAIDKLLALIPDIRTLAYQDDVCILVRPSELDRLLGAVERFWAELGWAVRRSKLQIGARGGTDTSSFSKFWRQRLAPS